MTPDFILTRRFAVRNNELIVLPWLKPNAPCFNPKEFSQELQVDKYPAKMGGAKTIFAGKNWGKNILILAVRLDKKDSTPARALRDRIPSLMATARDEGLNSVRVLLDGRHGHLALAVQEGAELGAYSYLEFKSDKTEPMPVHCVVTGKMDKGLQKSLDRQAKVNFCVNFARDVLNGPPNLIHPESLAGEFKEFGTRSGLEMEVWDHDKLKDERCGGILAVGQGAASKPRLVIGRYAPENPDFHLALVGKGVTFDTGGYSLKPSPSQVDMKYDMGGAACVFGAACAIARLGLPIQVTVVTPLVENDVSATAYHVQDVIRTRSGKTVEILNTDAEGRVILTDGLTIAQEANPDAVIDAATLTGAAVAGLGEDIAAFYSTNKALSKKLAVAADKVDEAFWEMPLHKPYAKMLKSNVADVNNTGKSRMGGSITAALFLQEWIKPRTRWMHLDIAGPGGKEEALGFLPKGAKGFGVRTLVEMAQNLV